MTCARAFDAALDDAAATRRDARRCRAAARQIRHTRVLPGVHRRSELEPRALRRREVRLSLAGRERQPEGDVQPHARRRLRPRGQAAHHARHLRAQRRLLRRLLSEGAAGAHAASARLRRRRSRRVDVVAMPTMPTPPFKLGEKTDDPLQMYLADVFTVSANLAGLPGISVPCGFSTDGLPIGFQLMGRMFDEATLLRVADDAYERAPTGTTRRPSLFEPGAFSYRGELLVELADVHRRDRDVAVVHGPDVGALRRSRAFLVDAPVDRAIRSGALAPPQTFRRLRARPPASSPGIPCSRRPASAECSR